MMYKARKRAWTAGQAKVAVYDCAFWRERGLSGYLRSGVGSWK